jgi:PRC-barrel domain protein
MMARSCGQRPGFSTVALALLLAAAPAQADSPPSSVGGSGASEPTAPHGQPPAAATPGEGKPSPDAPPAAGKKTEPPQPKNLETLAAGEAIGLLGKKVRDVAGEDMGMVVDVLVDSDGRPRAAIIDFGGFLGVGSRKIAVDWRLLQLKPVDATMSVLLGLTRADVQAAPEYKPSSTPAQPVVIVGPPPPSTEVSTPANAPR